MSPIGFRTGLGAALAALLAAVSPARAIVGGEVETGPPANSVVMVLSAKGGVCSAVVVAPDALLTAAHCASGAGDYRVHFKDEGGQPVLLEPAALAIHPGYDRGAIAGRRRSIDLALVRLSAPLPSRFRAASLSAAMPPAGTVLRIGGYGVALEGDGRSSGTFRIVDLLVTAPYGPSKILVWTKGEGRGACHGDSGGPMMSRQGASLDGDRPLVVAVSTWATGRAKASCGDISQGVLLGPQRGWIDGVLAGWGREAAWR